MRTNKKYISGPSSSAGQYRPIQKKSSLAVESLIVVSYKIKILEKGLLISFKNLGFASIIFIQQ